MTTLSGDTDRNPEDAVRPIDEALYPSFTLTRLRIWRLSVPHLGLTKNVSRVCNPSTVPVARTFTLLLLLSCCGQHYLRGLYKQITL